MAHISAEYRCYQAAFAAQEPFVCIDLVNGTFLGLTILIQSTIAKCTVLTMHPAHVHFAPCANSSKIQGGCKPIAPDAAVRNIPPGKESRDAPAPGAEGASHRVQLLHAEVQRVHEGCLKIEAAL